MIVRIIIIIIIFRFQSSGTQRRRRGIASTYDWGKAHFVSKVAACLQVRTRGSSHFEGSVTFLSTQFVSDPLEDFLNDQASGYYVSQPPSLAEER